MGDVRPMVESYSGSLSISESSSINLKVCAIDLDLPLEPIAFFEAMVHVEKEAVPKITKNTPENIL